MTALTFEVATQEDFEGLCSDKRTYLAKPTEFTPLEVYLSLKGLFGAPDTESIDEDKQQWTFLLKTGNALVEVYDWRLESWSIGVYEKNNKKKAAITIANELVRVIRQQSSRQKATLQALVKRPQGQVIENPYVLYYQTASELLQWAQELNDAYLADPHDSVSQQDWMRRYPLCRAAFFQFVAALEGFLNLIYDLYLRAELRDDRIVDRLSREQIDVKLRLAPVYCECFSGTPIDHTTDAFRTFHKLANIRNDFVHANLTKAMRTPIVRHEGGTYLVQVSRSSVDDLVPGSFSSFDIAHLQKVKSAVDGIVAQILASMKPRFRRELGEIMHDDYVEVEYEDGIPIVVHGHVT
jgi:hypothetical protein